MSRPRVVIRAFTLRRDIATALLLARQLEERGCDVIVASGRDFVRTMRFWKPDVAVINTVGQIERCAQLAPDASIIMLPGEGANSRKHCDAIHLVDKPESYERVDRYLLWGKATERYFHEILPDADHSRLVVCGSPRLDLAKYSPRYPRSPSDQKTVGFIGRYHILNRYNAVPAIFSMQRPEKMEGALWQVENFFCMITIIRRIIEETDLKISLRPHPLEAPEGYSFMNEGFFKGRVEIDDSLDVADWTARQRVIVAPSSQSFYEAYVLGVPIINVDPLTGNADRIREINPNASLSQKASYTPTDYDEAMEMVTGDLARLPPVPEIDDHMEQFHEWFAPESATRRVVDEILGVAQGRRRGTLVRMPSAIMNAWDRVSFRRICAREPLHPNFSYHRHHHPVPGHLKKVIANIDAKNSILERGEQAQ